MTSTFPISSGFYDILKHADGETYTAWVYVSPSGGSCLRIPGELGSLAVDAKFLRTHTLTGPAVTPEHWPPTEVSR